MKTLRVLFLTLAVATLTAAAASAQACAPRIDGREAWQQARIRQGIRSGELTRGEARRLERGEFRIHRLEHRAEARGPVTLRERARIDHAQNVESRRIWRDKHNGFVR